MPWTTLGIGLVITALLAGYLHWVAGGTERVRRLVDDRTANKFPEPADATGIDEVLVGRLRADFSQPPGRGLDLFACGDQLRKGAALNAVQIAERIFAAESALA